jgi:orotidine-5'-phosphate decarboxylase
MSLDRLIEKIVETSNPTVAGLDPKLDFIPNFIKEKAFKQYGNTLKAAAEAIIEYNKGLIDALFDIVPAVKPQCAYYEMYGFEGMRALYETICYAKQKGMYVITDGKRNDIGTTMEAYAVAHLGQVEVNGTQIEPFKGDSLTVNGYLGTDGISPLIDICNKYDKGIFVLVKTSNPSSGELQDQKIVDKTVYATMGEMCEKWGEDLKGKYGYSGVGAVVGATYKQQLEELRGKLKKTFFLVPGYGAQGGGASDIANAFDENGLGAIVNSSRAIMCAYKMGNYDEIQYAQAAREEALRMKEDIGSVIPKIRLPKGGE